MKLNPYQNPPTKPYHVGDSFQFDDDGKPDLDGFFLRQNSKHIHSRKHVKLYTTLSGLKQHVRYWSPRGVHMRLWFNLGGEWVEFRPDELLETKGREELIEKILRRKVSDYPGV